MRLIDTLCIYAWMILQINYFILMPESELCVVTKRVFLSLPCLLLFHRGNKSIFRHIDDRLVKI
jgi:hypothetical protein